MMDAGDIGRKISMTSNPCRLRLSKILTCLEINWNNRSATDIEKLLAKWGKADDGTR